MVELRLKIIVSKIIVSFVRQMIIRIEFNYY